MTSIIAIGSDNVWSLNGLIDQISSAYINDATVSCTVYDIAGTSIFTFSLAYVTSSDGDYQGTMMATNTAELTQGQQYTIKTTATDGGTTLVLEDSFAASYPG